LSTLDPESSNNGATTEFFATAGPIILSAIAQKSTEHRPGSVSAASNLHNAHGQKVTNCGAAYSNYWLIFDRAIASEDRANTPAE
jgi:hypothetical protein